MRLYRKQLACMLSVSVGVIAFCQTPKEQWTRFPVALPKKAQYPQLLRVLDGTVSIRFRASVKNRHFDNILCMDSSEIAKGFDEWFVPNILQKATINQALSSPSTYEMRVCNCACGPTNPRGYSFWKLR